MCAQTGVTLALTLTLTRHPNYTTLLTLTMCTQTLTTPLTLEDEKAKKEKFAMDLATFILQYEMEDARPGPTFAKGDWVQILKKEGAS